MAVVHQETNKEAALDLPFVGLCLTGETIARLDRRMTVRRPNGTGGDYVVKCARWINSLN